MSAVVSRFVIQTATMTWVLLGPLSLLPIMFSAMMFDAPGATGNAPTIVLFFALLGFPLVCVASVIESQKRKRNGQLRAAMLWSCAPLVNVAVGAAAAAWISFMQDGRFAG